MDKMPIITYFVLVGVTILFYRLATIILQRVAICDGAVCGLIAGFVFHHYVPKTHSVVPFLVGIGVTIVISILLMCHNFWISTIATVLVAGTLSFMIFTINYTSKIDLIWAWVLTIAYFILVMFIHIVDRIDDYEDFWDDFLYFLENKFTLREEKKKNEELEKIVAENKELIRDAQHLKEVNDSYLHNQVEEYKEILKLKSLNKEAKAKILKELLEDDDTTLTEENYTFLNNLDDEELSADITENNNTNNTIEMEV